MIVTLLLSKLPFRFTDKTPATKNRKMASGLMDLIHARRHFRQVYETGSLRVERAYNLSDTRGSGNGPVAPPICARQFTSVISLLRKEKLHMHSDECSAQNIVGPQ